MAAENGHRVSGIAAIMGIGKAVPAHVFPQKSFPDYYFDISNSNHMVDLKAKFTKISASEESLSLAVLSPSPLITITQAKCAYRSASGKNMRTMIEKRHLYTSDDLLRSTPSITAYNSTSLTLRQELANHGEVVPGTRDAVVSELREEGIVFTLHRDVPRQIGDSIGRLVERALLRQQQPANASIGAADAAAPDLNGMFWVVHAGGREILDRMESKLGLGKEKLEASRAVMAQYGNTRSSCVVLVMEEMRRRSEERGLRTAGEGLDMGMLVGFGPGLTVETIGEKWAKHRRILNPVFQLEKLKLMLPVFSACCEELISRYLPTENNRKMYQMNKEIESILRGMIGKRMQAMKEGESTKDDLLGILLESNTRHMEVNGQSNQGLTIKDIMEECKLFYFAGADTTSVLLTWIMLLLSMHPEWQDRAREEILGLFGKNKPDYDGLSRLKIADHGQ
uniref:Chalcone/stilbene synthase N-terminal domain-containing protein n=1 Tax=Oryza rufipogon TaxID=4529 RepID=A0A0E0MYX8_ORYRU